MKSINYAFYLLLAIISFSPNTYSDTISDNPILFVTMVPNPADFGTTAATFGNHLTNPSVAFRGGDLWIRYADGTLKNLTRAAGYGTTGFQGAIGIAVRDPSVHWDGNKAIFSMLRGGATQQYQITADRWQLYEITGLALNDTPVITKVVNQPTEYNNISPVYASDDSIIFSSDRPRDDTVLHTYPQRDEYESSPVVTGLWKLTSAGALSILDHSPSGDFNPIIDSFGRVIFSRWDHLQRDQQNIGASLGAFNYASETSNQALSVANEVFPEPRSNLDPDKQDNLNLFTINQFFPWMMNQDGTDLETLNHIGRQEVGVYTERSFNDDPNVEEFYGQYMTGKNQNEFTIFLHIKEKASQAGVYVGTSCQEFGTHSAGQILQITGAPDINPNDMVVTYLTHPDTAAASDSPGATHSGLYRDPLPLSNNKIIVSHTANTRQDSNIGTSATPLSRYDFRLKLLDQSAQYGTAGALLTSGISKNVTFWSPDSMITYNGVLWEVMPVEVKSRTRPSATTQSLPSVEAGVLESSGVSLTELQSYLKEQNLALVVSRNLTMRDKNDRQQPINLRVSGSSTESIPKDGKIYDISLMQFFQGDLIRGYSNGNNDGRRVIAQPMHSVESGINPVLNNSISGSVQIAEDGSMAAFVPANRALSWQVSDSSGRAVVRERYWITFQPGEVRVCASCHGINTVDHTGKGAPTNSPIALARLLAHWKNLPTPSTYSMTLSGTPKIKSKGKFSLKIEGGSASDLLSIKGSINGKSCANSKQLLPGSTLRNLKGKFPDYKGAKIQFSLYSDGLTTTLATSKIRIPGKKQKRSTALTKNDCKRMMGSLK